MLDDGAKLLVWCFWSEHHQLHCMQELLEYTVSAVEEDPCFEDGSSCHMNSEAEWEPGQEHMEVAVDLRDSCPSPSIG